MIENNGKPFNIKTILLVVIVGVVFFGWQKYLENKYPNLYNKTESTKEIVDTKSDTSSSPIVAEKKPIDGAIRNTIEPSNEVRHKIFTQWWYGELSSLGMSLKDLKTNKFKDKENRDTALAGSFPVFSFGVLGLETAPNFNLSRLSANSWVGVAELADGSVIERKMEINEETGGLVFDTKIVKRGNSFKGFFVELTEELRDQTGGSILMPSFDIQEVILRTIDQIEHLKFDKELNKTFTGSDMLGLSSQYFTTAFLDESSLKGTVSIVSSPNGTTAAKMTYEFPPAGDLPVVKTYAFVGAKSFDLLSATHNSLTNVINFGFFSTIAGQLLKLLKFLNQFVNNWGFAIILLTLIVRLIMLPLNIKSFKSMKRMQLIQPKLQAIREKFKDDSTALNRETMSLMKNEKVNPLGGCLPMLLQMPVFFALYQVLGQSVELYQVPFIWWIQDLSVKDPFYVLPVLMGVTLFIQQKTTPSTMDPQQAKIMMWMPVIFSVFTLGLPAGLTLYIFVSTLFGVIQQQIFMMDTKNKEAK